MALRLSALVIILSSLKLSRGALVLPRPPSSPNDINQSSSSSSSNKLGFDQKLYNVKPRFQNSRTNVEKPNTDNYKLLEIELRGGGGSGPNGISFGEILREVFREEGSPIEKEPLESPLNKMQSFNNKMSISDPSFSDNEKLYYLKQGRVNSADISHKRTSWEPRSYLKSVGAYDRGDKRYATKSFYRPKKYFGEKNMRNSEVDAEGRDNSNYLSNSLRNIEIEDDRNRMILGGNNYNELVVTYGSNEPTIEVYTTENSLPTSSELPKQIPPPPSRVPNQTVFANTTPVLKYMSRRSDILPRGYSF